MSAKSTPTKDWAKCTVTELKEELTTRGLPVSGRKLQLVNRLQSNDLLQEALEKEVEEPDASEQEENDQEQMNEDENDEEEKNKGGENVKEEVIKEEPQDMKGEDQEVIKEEQADIKVEDQEEQKSYVQEKDKAEEMEVEEYDEQTEDAPIEATEKVKEENEDASADERIEEIYEAGEQAEETQAGPTQTEVEQAEQAVETQDAVEQAEERPDPVEQAEEIQGEVEQAGETQGEVAQAGETQGEVEQAGETQGEVEQAGETSEKVEQTEEKQGEDEQVDETQGAVEHAEKTQGGIEQAEVTKEEKAEDEKMESKESSEGETLDSTEKSGDIKEENDIKMVEDSVDVPKDTKVKAQSKTVTKKVLRPKTAEQFLTWLEWQQINVYRLSTLFLHPLTAKDVTGDAVVGWAKRAAYFCISCDKEDNGVGVLTFMTSAESEEAKAALTKALGSKLVHTVSDEIEEQIKDTAFYKIETPNIMADKTTIILEDEQGMTEEEICQHFPGAISVFRPTIKRMRYGVPDSLHSTFFIVFPKEISAEKALESNKKMKLKTVEHYMEFYDVWSENQEREFKLTYKLKESLDKAREQVFNDIERTEMCKAAMEMYAKKNKLSKKKGLLPGDKQKQMQKINNQWGELVRAIDADTEMRIELELPVPEPYSLMTSSTCKMLADAKKARRKEAEEKDEKDNKEKDSDKKSDTKQGKKESPKPTSGRVSFTIKETKKPAGNEVLGKGKESKDESNRSKEAKEEPKKSISGGASANATEEISKLAADPKGWFTVRVDKTSKDLNEKGVQDVFTKYGTITEIKFTSKNVYVRYDTKASASEAVTALWGTKWNIIVPAASSKPPKQETTKPPEKKADDLKATPPKQEPKSEGGSSLKDCVLRISGFDKYKVTANMIEKHFHRLGVQEVNLNPKTSTKGTKGSGIVTFKSVDGAQRALKEGQRQRLGNGYQFIHIQSLRRYDTEESKHTQPGASNRAQSGGASNRAESRGASNRENFRGASNRADTRGSSSRADSRGTSNRGESRGKRSHSPDRKVQAKPQTPHTDFKLFIGDLPSKGKDESASLKELNTLFRSFSRDIARVEVIMDDYENRSRGFGYVSFKTKAAMENAAKVSDVVDGKKVTIQTFQAKISSFTIPKNIPVVERQEGTKRQMVGTPHIPQVGLQQHIPPPMAVGPPPLQQPVAVPVVAVNTALPPPGVMIPQPMGGTPVMPPSQSRGSKFDVPPPVQPVYVPSPVAGGYQPETKRPRLDSNPPATGESAAVANVLKSITDVLSSKVDELTRLSGKGAAASAGDAVAGIMSSLTAIQPGNQPAQAQPNYGNQQGQPNMYGNQPPQSNIYGNQPPQSGTPTNQPGGYYGNQPNQPGGYTATPPPASYANQPSQPTSNYTSPYDRNQPAGYGNQPPSGGYGSQNQPAAGGYGGQSSAYTPTAIGPPSQAYGNQPGAPGTSPRDRPHPAVNYGGGPPGNAPPGGPRGGPPVNAPPGGSGVDMAQQTLLDQQKQLLLQQQKQQEILQKELKELQQMRAAALKTVR